MRSEGEADFLYRFSSLRQKEDVESFHSPTRIMIALYLCAVIKVDRQTPSGLSVCVTSETHCKDNSANNVQQSNRPIFDTEKALKL